MRNDVNKFCLFDFSVRLNSNDRYGFYKKNSKIFSLSQRLVHVGVGLPVVALCIYGCTELIKKGVERGAYSLLFGTICNEDTWSTCFNRDIENGYFLGLVLNNTLNFYKEFFYLEPFYVYIASVCFVSLCIVLVIGKTKIKKMLKALRQYNAIFLNRKNPLKKRMPKQMDPNISREKNKLQKTSRDNNIQDYLWIQYEDPQIDQSSLIPKEKKKTKGIEDPSKAPTKKANRQSSDEEIEKANVPTLELSSGNQGTLGSLYDNGRSRPDHLVIKGTDVKTLIKALGGKVEGNKGNFKILFGSNKKMGDYEVAHGGDRKGYLTSNNAQNVKEAIAQAVRVGYVAEETILKAIGPSGDEA